MLFIKYQKQKMKKNSFLFLLLILKTTVGNTYNFTDAQITVQTVSSGILRFTTTSDSCKKIVVRSQQIYHLSIDHYYESWPMGSLQTSMTLQDAIYNTDMGVDSTGKTVVFPSIEGPVISLSGGIRIFTLNSDYTYNTQKLYAKNLGEFYSFTFVEGNIIYAYSNQLLTSNYILTSYQLSTGYQILTATFINYDSINVTPDFQKAVVWTQTTNIKFITLSNLSVTGTYNPQVAPSSGTTSKITFSSDSALAIVETDAFNPVAILFMANYSTFTSFSVPRQIIEAHFVDPSNSVVILLCSDATVFVDLTNGNAQYTVAAMVETVYAADQNNYLYSCSNNTIKQTSLNFTRISLSIPLPTPSPTPSPMPQTNNQSNGSVPSQPSAADSQFYETYELGEFSQSVYYKIDDPLTTLSEATNILSTAVTSMPITIYFLGFVNYLTLSSLYVLLNFTLPEHIYKYLSFTYSNINSNILSVIGLTPQIPLLSEEKVDRAKPLFFGVSSDVGSSDTVPLAFMLANFTLIALSSWLSSLLRRNHVVRELLSSERWSMVYGQLINMMIQLTLPWSFLMLCVNCRNFAGKVNNGLFVLLFFVGLCFPFIFLLELLLQRRDPLFKKSDIKSKQEQAVESASKVVIVKTRKNLLKSSAKNIVIKKKTEKKEKTLRFEGNQETKQPSRVQEKKKKQTKFKILKIQIEEEVEREISVLKKVKVSKKTNKPLLTSQIAEQWHLCQANFIFPALVLLPDPSFFLIAISGFSLLGVVICFGKKKRRTNSVVLSLYPLLFHACFMVFYWCKSVRFIATVQVFCLGVFLIGSIHHCLTFLYEIFTFVRFIWRKCWKGHQVQPLDSGKEEGKTEKSKTKVRDKKVKSLNERVVASSIVKDNGISVLRKIKKTHFAEKALKVNFSATEDQQ